MMTSNYARIRQIPEGMVPVSISIKPPYWWGKSRRHYPPLCPTTAMLKMTPADYDVLYEQILAKLDPAEVFAELGDNAVLLCFESPNVKCHRRWVAQWLETSLGIVVPELGFDRSVTLPYNESPQKIAKPARKKRGDTIPGFLFFW